MGTGSTLADAASSSSSSSISSIPEPPYPYPVPAGVHALPASELDLRPDAEVDAELGTARLPVAGAKNVWFFWDAGYGAMAAYLRRNVRAWHRRLAPRGWAVRVVDLVDGSALHAARFVDARDPALFPRAFADGTLAGRYAAQHRSDLVRWPLLLRHGGVYADAGFLQIGDLDALWRATVADPASPYRLLAYAMSGDHPADRDARCLANFCFAALPANPFFERCHRLLLALWAADGGRTSTDGMHASPLVRGAPLMGGSFVIDEPGGVRIGPAEVSRMLTDYVIQGHVMTAVMGLVDDAGGWDGPRYAVEHIYAIDSKVGAQLVNEMTGWDGRLAYDLMSLRLPEPGAAESPDQRRAREIVEACLQRSFGFKLAHGIILRVCPCTLGSLWRDNEGSDNVAGTYAHWLRYAMTYWSQDELPPRVDFQLVEPFRRGRLLGED